MGRCVQTLEIERKGNLTCVMEMFVMVKKTSRENNFVITYFINIVTDTAIHFKHCSIINPTDHYNKLKISTIFLVFHFILYKE